MMYASFAPLLSAQVHTVFWFSVFTIEALIAFILHQPLLFSLAFQAFRLLFLSLAFFLALLPSFPLSLALFRWFFLPSSLPSTFFPQQRFFLLLCFLPLLFPFFPSLQRARAFSLFLPLFPCLAFFQAFSFPLLFPCLLALLLFPLAFPRSIPQSFLSCSTCGFRQSLQCPLLLRSCIQDCALQSLTLFSCIFRTCL